jgi:hypothetical protein
MLLSILRAPLTVRTALIALFLVAFIPASTTRLPAQQSRVHRRSVTTQTSPHRARTSSAHSRRRTASRSSNHTTPYSATRRRSTHRQASLVRTRMPIRRYAWMSSRSVAPPAHIVRERETELAEAPSAGVPSMGASSSEASEQANPLTDAEGAEASTDEIPPAELAANKIAAAEIPASRHAVAETSASLSLRDTKIFAMAPLRGSLESLVRQNEKTNADNLERIENEAQLRDRIASGLLVPVPESEALTVNPNLPGNRRYCRPWTASFLTDLSRAHQAQFHHSFEVSSAVRTVEYQRQLMRTNGNAAPAEGDTASPHLTGATIDIAKSGLTRRELYWMRDRLNSLQSEGKIDVEEEFRQACFHITVYKSYVGAGPAHKPHKLPATPPAESPASPSTTTDVVSHGV